MTGPPRSREASTDHGTRTSPSVRPVTVDPGDSTRTAASAAPISARTTIALAARSLHVRERGRYEVIGEHGRGGLGRVSRAHDTELGRDVAVKELLQRSDDVGEIRFLREALITARLEHPGDRPGPRSRPLAGRHAVLRDEARVGPPARAS